MNDYYDDTFRFGKDDENMEFDESIRVNEQRDFEDDSLFLRDKINNPSKATYYVEVSRTSNKYLHPSERRFERQI